jgi:hypothetical protein
LAVLPVIAVSRPGKTVRTDPLGLVRALHISLSRQLGIPKRTLNNAAARAALVKGLLLTAGRGCRAWHAGALRPVGARGCVRMNGRGKRSVSKAAPGL